MPSLGTTVRVFMDPVLAVVFPSSCPVCSEPLEHPTRGPLCEPCWGGVASRPSARCRCGRALPATSEGCSRCRRGLSLLSIGFSLGPYDGPLRVAVHELKYRGRRRVAGRLAEAIAELQEARAVLCEGSLLVPVPLHPRRRRDRGFNQAELLASELARLVDLPMSAAALVRRSETRPQTGLSAAERRRNVAGAFAVRRRSKVAGRVVVLVDDVVTTGATARACARALLDSGAKDVRIVSAARVD
jgi:ComF family protein